MNINNRIVKGLRLIMVAVTMSLVVVSCILRSKLHPDILVVGGGASGVSASVQAARMGSDVVLLEESCWLGGMLSAAGVSAIDGNYNLRAGFWGEFLDSLVCRYGSYDALKTGWVSNVQFEPSVANEIFHSIVEAERNITLMHGWHVTFITKAKNGRWVVYAEDEEGNTSTIFAKVVIDATELGDLAAMAGIPFDKGMESKYLTGEDIAPESSNDIIQDLTYVAILKDYGHPVPMEEPEGYDVDNYACCCDNPLCINPKEPDRMWPKEMMISYGALPENKYMINWPIEGNDYYLDLIEMGREERIESLKKAKAFTMGMVYFIKHELGYENLALADDEFPTDDKLPLIPYYRESRRIHGLVRFTYCHIQDPFRQELPLYRTSIAVGDYPIDHHHGRYTGVENLPRLYYSPIPSFGVPMGTLLPEGFDNFIVAEKSISVSNIANGCTRLQPVVLQIGTAAGIIASIAIRNDIKTVEVPVRSVQNEILNMGGYLQPYLDVEKASPMFAVYQRIGSTGILKGTGKNVDWNNQFWLRAGDKLLLHELRDILEVYPSAKIPDGVSTQEVSVLQARSMVASIIGRETEWGREASQEKAITRGQYAELIDSELDPFNTIPVEINGKIEK